MRRLLAILCLVAAPARAATGQDQQLWVNATITATLPSGFAYTMEVQPRLSQGFHHLQQLFLRPAIGWRLSPAVTVYGGYAHIFLPIRGGPDRNEERTFQQLSWSLGALAGGTLASRARLEQRWLSNGRDTGWRARQMLRYVHPLGSPRRPRALVSMEAFAVLNDTDWGAHAGFDQLRTFAGIEVPLAGKSTLEAGYMNHAINDPGDRYRVNHILSLSLFIRP